MKGYGRNVAYVHARHFTLEEARIALPEAKALAEEMVDLKQRLDERGFDVYRHEYFGGAGPNGEHYFPRELERLVEILRTFDSLGILVKGVEVGLIDFPHIRANGEEVYLCYRAGESDIVAWHSIEGGYAGRRPLSEL